jgi:hypothetical protein
MNACRSAFPASIACSPTPSRDCRRDLGFGGQSLPVAYSGPTRQPTVGTSPWSLWAGTLRVNIVPPATLCLLTWNRFSTAMTGCGSSGAIGSMHSRTSGGSPKRSSTSETRFWSLPTERTRVGQRRGRRRARISALQAPRGLSCSAGGLPRSLGGPRSRPAAAVGGVTIASGAKRPGRTYNRA